MRLSHKRNAIADRKRHFVLAISDVNEKVGAGIVIEFEETVTRVSDIGRLVSRSARAYVCRRSNLAAGLPLSPVLRTLTPMMLPTGFIRRASLFLVSSHTALGAVEENTRHLM
jgi:hypothetical protein